MTVGWSPISSRPTRRLRRRSRKSADESIKAEQKKTDGIRKESGKIVENAEQAAEDVADAWKDAGKDAQKAMSDVEIGDVDIEVTADTHVRRRISTAWKRMTSLRMSMRTRARLRLQSRAYRAIRA